MLLYEPDGEVHPNVAVVMEGHRRLERGDMTAIEHMFSPDIVSIMANQEYVSSVVRLAGSKGLRQFTATVVDLMRMESGHIAEFWRYYEDPVAARTFFDAR